MRIGVDLGGTKIEAIAIDGDGHELLRRRVATPTHDGAAIVAAIADLVRGVETVLGERGTVGIGTPGAISPATGVMKNSNTTCLNGQPLDRQLADALGREVRLANDANCFTLSEAVDGAAEDGRVVFGVIIGTGTGGGVVVDRQVLTGANAIAGEWGHNPLPWSDVEDAPAADCYCGKRGCIETYLCGAGLVRDHRERTGDELSAEVIAQGATEAARTSITRYRRRLAKALASVINVLDPDVVVLGGGLSNIPEIAEGLPLADHVFSDRVETAVRRAKHGDSSGVRGAAWLWERPR